MTRINWERLKKDVGMIPDKLLYGAKDFAEQLLSFALILIVLHAVVLVEGFVRPAHESIETMYHRYVVSNDTA